MMSNSQAPEPGGFGSLHDPDVLAQEITDDLRPTLAKIEDVLGDLEQRVGVRAGEEA